mmetsp:Transcript_15190/g.24670  ORF Transcript_15190/g.24670 Transcript_15190/m.24670 type:complete len:204 (+) Transcript_15190:355-966(+)
MVQGIATSGLFKCFKILEEDPCGLSPSNRSKSYGRMRTLAGSLPPSNCITSAMLRLISSPAFANSTAFETVRLFRPIDISRKFHEPRSRSLKAKPTPTTTPSKITTFHPSCSEDVSKHDDSRGNLTFILASKSSAIFRNNKGTTNATSSRSDTTKRDSPLLGGIVPIFSSIRDQLQVFCSPARVTTAWCATSGTSNTTFSTID